MTYYNIVLRAGHRRMARTLADAGIAGAIVPDLPIDELDGWGDEADRAGVESVLLVAPTTPDGAAEGHLRPFPWLRLRGRPDGGDRRAGRAERERRSKSRRGARRRQTHRCSSASASPPRSRPEKWSLSQTALLSGRRSCTACSRAPDRKERRLVAEFRAAIDAEPLCRAGPSPRFRRARSIADRHGPVTPRDGIVGIRGFILW